MRIEQVTGFPIYLTHRFTNLFIRISRTRDIRCYGSMTVIIQCQYTGKLLGSPTSIALAIVAMEGRGLYFPVCKYW